MSPLVPALAILLTLPTAARSLDVVQPGWALEQWTTEDGVPSAIYSLALDPHGRLALGTTDGLGLFDGRRFVFLRQGDPGGPPDDRAIWVGNEPEGGAMWVVTEASRAQRRTREQIVDHGLLGAGEATMGFHLPDGFVVRSDRGFFRLEGAPSPWTDLPAGSSSLGWLDGALWAWTGAQVFRQDGDGVWTEQEGQRALWDQLADRAHLERHPHLRVHSDGISLDGALLIRSPASGALRVNHFLEMDDGSIFLATFSHGLLRLRRTPVTVHRPPGTSTVEARRVPTVVPAGPGGQPWAQAGAGGWWTPGEVSLRQKTVEWGPGPALLPAPGEEPAVPLPMLAGVRIWGAYGGLYRQLSAEDDASLVLDPRPVSTRCPLSFINSYAWLRDGSFLTGRGARWTPDGGWDAIEADCAAMQAVRALLELPGGEVLLGGPQIGVSILTAEGTVQPLPGPAGLRPRHLRLGGGRVWMATERYGLCVAPLGALRGSSDPWRCLGRAEGLGEAQVHASFDDTLGRVWVSTNRGLVIVDGEALLRFARGEQPDVATLRLASGWGFEDPELNGFAGFSGLQQDDGTLWFPSQGGLVEVDPSMLQLPRAVHVALSDALLDGRPASLDEELPVDHGPLVLSTQVSPLGWADQAEVRYRLGDAPWRPLPEGTLELNHLPPGASVLELQARLLGEWGAIDRTSLRRRPALRERTWFPLAVAVVALLVTAGGLGWRLRVLRRRARELDAQVEDKTRALADQNQELSARSTELLLLHETASAQAARLAELDELKQRFIADLAHELRTPLTLVSGALQQVAGTPEDQPRLRSATKNTGRLEELVGELFDLTRLESGSLRLRTRRVDLALLAAELVERYAPGFEGSGRRLELRAPGPVLLWADPNLMERVIGNLLANGLKHGAGPVTLSIEEREDEVSVQVRDRGPGVPDALREVIFERFVQGSTGDQRAKDGAGIGLSLAKELVALHGGTIGVESPTEGGAAFWFRLPRGVSHLALDDLAPAPDALPPPRRSLPLEQGVPGQAVVLLVEDNAEIRAFMAEVLGETFTVLEAEDGSRGLQLAKEHAPAAIVSDVRMPVLDGLSMARQLRADPTTADIPLLFVSAKTQPGERVDGLEVGDDYLVKPFGIAELRARVRNLVQRREPVVAPVEDGGAEEGGAPSHRAAFHEQLVAVARDRLTDSEFRVGQLARAMAVSTRTLRDRLRELELPPPATWLLETRLEVAREHLRAERFRTVSEVAAAVGLSRAYFSRAYRAWAGHPPTEALAETGPTTQGP